MKQFSDKTFFSALFQKTAALFFPIVKCLCCGQERTLDETGLCADCAAELMGGYRPLQRKVMGKSVFGIYAYAGCGGALVRRLKFDGIRPAAVVLGNAMAAFYLEEALDAEVIVPVPVGRKRRRSRGFNQSTLLAKRIAHFTGLPVEERCLRRIRETRAQSLLEPLERFANVDEAFLAQDVLGKRVLLVDDVITSGATIGACIRALQKAGAAQIIGLCATVSKAGKDRA